MSNSHLEGTLSGQVGVCSVCSLQAEMGTRCRGQRESSRKRRERLGLCSGEAPPVVLNGAALRP